MAEKEGGNKHENLLKDIQTLSLATLALAAKSTESPRRLSSLLPPSYQLLQRRRLYVPSQEYDILRATLVRAKLLVLRVLRFELRRDSPLAWIEPFSRRVLEGDDEPLGEGPDWNAERRGEEGIVAYGMAGGGLVRRARARSVDAYVATILASEKFLTLRCTVVFTQARYNILMSYFLSLSEYVILILGTGAKIAV